ncbi:MAG: P-loop NTPase [Thermoproteota archaeon]
MSDPRISVITNRLEGIDNLIAVSSGKGGVGKSLIASSLAAILARRGHKVGLFDLDFTSPSTHLILGVRNLQPEEEQGIIPPQVQGMRYMSMVYYSKNYASPLRGTDVSNALVELLAITRWGDLDFLVIDTPPGIGDATLDIIRFIDRIKFMVITTPSKLAFETVRKLLDLLSELDVPVLGVIENMKRDESRFIQRKVEDRAIKYLGRIPFDPKLEGVIGDVDELLQIDFGKKLEGIVENLEGSQV